MRTNKALFGSASHNRRVPSSYPAGKTTMTPRAVCKFSRTVISDRTTSPMRRLSEKKKKNKIRNEQQRATAYIKAIRPGTHRRYQIQKADQRRRRQNGRQHWPTDFTENRNSANRNTSVGRRLKINVPWMKLSPFKSNAHKSRRNDSCLD